MGRLRHSLSHPFRRFKGAVNVQSEEDQVKNQDNTVGTLLPTSASQSTIRTIQSAELSRPLDLWKTAYGQLVEEDRRILSEVQVTASSIYQDDQPRDLIEEIIHLTTEQYEQYQQEATGKLRTSSRKIINAALSFKDIIGAVATFDPTQHAASAWAIVSLGLTMTKNHHDLRDALFDSSEYLADVLAQCAFIEKKFYLDGSSKTKEDLGNALIKLYKAILHYTARVQITQNASMGRKMLNSVTAITEHPLTELKSLVEKERGNLHKLIGLVSHLYHEEKAESILHKIDELADSMKLLIEQFSLVNLHVAEGAFYDSYVNEHEDFCLPGTRTELRSQISEWAKSSDGKCIFWLNGMAGTGKSTIARTVAQSFKEQGLLGATFFFKRGEADRGNAKHLISTIIKQLVTSHWGLVPHILNVIKNDLNISSKFLSEQFDKLLYQPLLKLHLNQLSTIVIVIDALDECDREDDIGVVLRLLFKLQDIKSVHVRIFLTSRPELPIRLGFKQDNNHQDLILHELPKPMIERDILLFLEHKLSEIQNGRSLPPAWPGKKATEELVRISVPLFIFAATACRFIEKGTHPKKRLQKVLEFQATTTANQMDKIYLPVLNQLMGEIEDDSQELLEEFRHIVGVIILLATPLSIESLGRLLQIPGEDISELLDHLNSVLYIPSHTKDPVRILHLSFRDYLLITESPFRINEQETHEKIASRCLRVMENKLMHNICNLASYGTQRLDVDNKIIKRHLSAELEYSCHYWVYHLQQSQGRISETKILSFLKQHFLHWLEALSLLGIISEAVGIIDTLKSGIWRYISAELSDFIYDAKRFTLKNIYIAGIAPLQLYYSGLIFSPMQSTIRKIFSDSIPKQIHILPQMEDLWSPGLQTLEGHSSPVNSVAFSPDGQTIASGSDDRTIKLWDTKTGMELQTFKGHSSRVQSVAFSPDGQMIASGSGGKTIKLWNTKTGMELQTLKGHSDRVISVAFSPDGQTIASGSWDRTIKLWNIKAGIELQTLKGHSHRIKSIAFSPDGQTIASGSHDETIKLWDTKTGIELQTFKGHIHWVESVAFSPDGQTIASGSDDKTIKLWDTKTGIELQTLKGHSGRVRSVAFSPDGQTIASGSWDRTIKLWDTKTGMELQTFKGHLRWVESVAFSPDGQTIASSSDDKTIKLWDTKTGMGLQTFKGHSDWVGSVAFSPDGQTIASGSHDETIKLWDTKTGMELQTFKGHSDWVKSVAFSPDGQTIASGSDDKTIKLWDTKTGIELQTLKGHSSRIQSVAFFPDRQTIASSSHDSTIKLWDTKTGMELQTFKGHSYWLESVAFSPDGQTIASSSWDRTIKLWDTKTGMELQTFKGHSDRVESVAFSPDGQTIASSSHDKTIKPWDIKTGMELQTFKGHPHWVKSVAFSPDGQTIASSSHDKTIKLWNIKTGMELQTFKGHSSWVKSVAFSPDGQTIASGSWDDTIKVWDTKTGVELQTLNGHSNPVTLSNAWVALGGENLIWLPVEYRDFDCYAVKDATLVLGHRNGRVSIVGFHTVG